MLETKRNYPTNPCLPGNLDEELKAFIQKGITGFDEEVFNFFALKQFEIQYSSIEYLRNYSILRGITPDTVKSWEQIPAVPASVFKEHVIATFPVQQTEVAIMTSGTSNPNMPGKIYRDKRGIEIIYLANAVMTKNYLFPDVERMKILLMVPSPEVAPKMGMAIGLDQMRQNFGTADSSYLITPDGMQWEMLFNALQESQETGRPVALIGATSGFVYFFNFCREQGLSFKLPPASRVCDGGGYLGVFGECSREEYLHLCTEVLGVPAEYCVNTLGTGETGTNYFDNVLHNYHVQKKGLSRCKECPPWARTIVVDPNTGQRLPKGKVGLLCHYDLTNMSNLLAVQTNNFGYESGDGFEIIGRADAGKKPADTVLHRMIRGQQCSTVADNMLGGEQQVCSTVADSMLAKQGASCATVADEMLGGSGEVCSTKADELLAKSPHGKMFNHLSAERLKKLKQMCPFLKLQGLLKKDNIS